MGLWIDKRTEQDIVHWDVRLTKGDSAYIKIELTDLQDREIMPREGDVIRVQIRTKQGQLMYSGEAECDGERILWHLAPGDTKDLIVAEYIWDMELVTFDGGDVFTFVPESFFELLGEVTK